MYIAHCLSLRVLKWKKIRLVLYRTDDKTKTHQGFSDMFFFYVSYNLIQKNIHDLPVITKMDLNNGYLFVRGNRYKLDVVQYCIYPESSVQARTVLLIFYQQSEWSIYSQPDNLFSVFIFELNTLRLLSWSPLHWTKQSILFYYCHSLW